MAQKQNNIGILGDEEPFQIPEVARPKEKPNVINFRNQAPEPIRFARQEKGYDFLMGSPILGEALTGIPTATNKEFDFVMDNLLSNEQARMQMEKDEATLQIVQDQSLTPEERTQRARNMGDVHKPSPGMLFTNTINIMDELQKQIVADEVDVQLLKDTNQKAQIAMIDNDPGMTWTQFMNKPREASPVIFAEMRADLLREQDIDQMTHDGLGQQPPQSLMELGNAVERGLIFSSPVAAEDAELVDWPQVWGELVDMDGDFVSDQFVSSMEQKYGQQWKWRWGAFLAREVGVDAAALWYASTIRGVRQVAFPGAGSSLSRRAVGVGVRASIVATAGTGAEAMIQEVINNRENFELNKEFFWRFAGEVGAETLMKGGSMLIPGLKGLVDTVRGTKAVRDVQRKMLTNEELARIRRVTEQEAGPLRLVQAASLRGEATEYKRLAAQVADGVADPAILQQKRAQIAEIAGVPENAIELWLAMDANMFDRRVLEAIGGEDLAQLADIGNLGRSAEHAELKVGIETNRNLVAGLLEQKDRISESIFEAQVKAGELGGPGAQRLKVLKSQRDKIDEDLKELQTVTKEAEELIEQLETGGVRTTGNALADKVAVGEGVGFRLMGNVTQRQQGVQDIFMSYINKDGGFQFRPPDRVTGNLNFVQKFKRTLRLNEPDTYANPGLMKDFFDTFNNFGQLNKEWDKVIKKSVDGLSSKQQERVFATLQKGNDAEQVFSVDQLIAEGMSPKEVDAYFAVRKGLDFSHIVNDQVMTARMIERGVKVYQDQPVNVFRTHALLSEEQKDAGFVVVQKVTDSSSKPKEAFQVVKQEELAELTSVIPAHTGYVPRVYANANFAVTVIDTATGKVSRVAAVSRQSKAIDIARKRQAQSEGNEVVVYHRWDENTGTMRMGIPRASIQMYDLLDNATADQLKASLEASGIEGADQIIAVFNKQDLGDFRNRFTGERQALPIEGRLAPTPQAIADYFAATAKNQSLGYWRDWAVKSFKDEYSNILKPGVHWSDPRAIPDSVASVRVNNTSAIHISDDVIQSAITDAQFMQRALKRSVFGTTGAERKVSSWLDNKVASMASSSSATQRVMGSLLDRTRFDVIGVARGLGAYPKLMLGNVAQIIVQGSQIAATVGAHPIHATGAAKELLEITLAASARGLKDNFPLPPNVEQTLNALRKSGYLSDVRTSDLANLAKTPDNPVPSGLGRIIQGGKAALDTVSTGPFRLGEATNRAMAFLTIRREFTAFAKKGQLKGLDGQAFTGRIDDDEFLRLVTNKAKIFALNMGRAGQLELLSGPGSVLLQFKQVMPKFTNIFETAELGAAEKVRAGMGMVGLWGPTAIPFLPDVMLGADAVGRLFTDDPSQTELFTQRILNLREAKDAAVAIARNATPADIRAMGYDDEFYDRLIRRGFVNAASDGDLDITNRVALGMFISESLENASWEDAIVSVSVAADLYDAAAKSGVLNVANMFSYANALGLYAAETTGAMPEGSYAEFIDNLRFSNRDTGLIGESFTAETEQARENAIIRLTAEFGQALSYVGQVGRFMEAQSSLNRAEATPELVDQTVPFFKTSTGNPTVPIEKRLIYQHIFGLTPGPIVEQLNKQKLDRIYRGRYDDYIDSQVDRYSSTTDYNKQIRIMSETLQDIEALQHILLGWEMEGVLPNNWHSDIRRKFSNALQRTHLPSDLQKVNPR